MSSNTAILSPHSRQAKEWSAPDAVVAHGKENSAPSAHSLRCIRARAQRSVGVRGELKECDRRSVPSRAAQELREQAEDEEEDFRPSARQSVALSAAALLQRERARHAQHPDQPDPDQPDVNVAMSGNTKGPRVRRKAGKRGSSGAPSKSRHNRRSKKGNIYFGYLTKPKSDTKQI